MQNSSTLSQAFREWWCEHRTRQGFPATAAELTKVLVAFLRDSTPQRERQRYGDVDYDWDHHVNTTSAAVGWRNRLLGLFHSPYQPTEPTLFREMLEALNLDFAQYTFIDLGSGKGRTLLMASEYPFQKVIGVELIPELNEQAQQNIREFQSTTRKCLNIESVCQDARTYEFPACPILLYLFNPLSESGLTQVIHNLEHSLQAHPRPAVILYHNPLPIHILDASPQFHRVSVTHQYAIYKTSTM